MATATRIRTNESGILATGEYGYPTGHLGHLTEQQEQALVAFKALCEQKGFFKPATDINLASHDDTTLLYVSYFHIRCRSNNLVRRFLRARRFVPEDALRQFKETEDWREANQIGAVYENIDVKEYEETRLLVSIYMGTK